MNKLIFLILLLVAAAIAIIVTLQGSKYSNLELENKKLQDSIKMNLSIIDSISTLQLREEEQIKDLYSAKQKIKNQYINVYEELKIKDSIISSYNIDSLNQFFSNRYTQGFTINKVQ
jgi:archaellum component FlaG (FlaF/FlaG flagellin family)